MACRRRRPSCARRLVFAAPVGGTSRGRGVASKGAALRGGGIAAADRNRCRRADENEVGSFFHRASISSFIAARP